LFEDSHRQLAHQRLTVGRALACDDEVCISDKFFESDGIEQQLDARHTFRIEVLQEGIAKTSSSAGTWHL